MSTETVDPSKKDEKLPNEIWRGHVNLWPGVQRAKAPKPVGGPVRLCAVTLGPDATSPSVFTWFTTKEEWILISPEVPKLFEDSTPYQVILAAAFRDLTK